MEVNLLRVVFNSELRSLKVLNLGFDDVSDAILTHLKGESPSYLF